MRGDRSAEDEVSGGTKAPPGGEFEEPEPGAEGAAAAESAEFRSPEFVELSAEEAAREMALCRGTLRRIEQMTAVAGVVCAVLALAVLGWAAGRAVALGLLLGTVLGWINFRWLGASVNAIGERIVKVQSTERGAAIVARGVGRIGLLAIVAYGIFECSVSGLMGFLAGLAMPVLAMTCEAAYEFVVSIRRPS